MPRRRTAGAADRTGRRAGGPGGRAARGRRAVSPAAGPAPPRIPPGQRMFVLDVPWELRQEAAWAGARWEPSPAGGWMWTGQQLPAALAPFGSLPFSWERWREDELNGGPRPGPPAAGDLTPRPHQRDAIAHILAALRGGRCGFLLADDVGLGKTLAAWAGVLAAGQVRVAVICCPLSVIPHWRATLLRIGTAGIRVLIVNYD